MNFLITLIVITGALFLFAVGGFSAAIWLPTRKKDYERIAQLMNLRPGMVMYDLGSGSGELLFYLSKKHDVQCVGIEISPILYFYSKIRSLFYRKVKIQWGDFFGRDLSDADIIYVFLQPQISFRLQEKLRRNIKETAAIVAGCFPFQHAKPAKISQKHNETSYYLYEKAALGGAA